MSMRYLSFAQTLSLLLSFLIVGCAGTEMLDPPPEPPESLYRKAITALQKKRYKAASEKFEQVELQHPYSQWATRAQINLIYAFFKQEAFEEVSSAAERFIRLHPRHPHVAYAFYMRGLSKYRQISSAYQDQGKTHEAQAAFQEVLNRFPESDYSWEASHMLKLCRDRLAEQEMVVGRFYLDRKEYLAAINRFHKIIEEEMFRETPYTEEALFSLTFAATHLGLFDEARNYASVLGHNFPKSPFYKRAHDLLQGRGSFSQSELNSMRRGVEEGSLIKRILEGMKPGVPGMTN